MLQRLGMLSLISKIHCPKCTLSQLTEKALTKLDNIEVEHNSSYDLNPARTSTLEPLSEDISHISTYLKPTFNFAAYANKSDTVQEFVKLGVDLHKVEKKNTEAVPFILGLKFNDVKEHIIFLNQLGLSNDDIASVITKNPYIFKEDLDNLEVRITYLKSKKFTDDMITTVISKNPFWLSYGTKKIDEKLGFFQKHFNLSGSEVRYLTTKYPKVITYKQHKIKLNMFVMKEEMGFKNEEIKQIILRTPKVLILEQNKILKTFEYLYNEMKVTHDKIVQSCEILTCREKRLKERHQFLVKLERDQFDSLKPNYIALSTLIKDSDANFATEVAKSSVQTFNLFLKTL